MCIRVIRQASHIEIWVASNAGENELERCIGRCRQFGMPIVVYRSGRGELAELTGTLLSNNVGDKLYAKNKRL